MAAHPRGGIEGAQAPLRLPRPAALPTEVEVGHEHLPGAPGHRPSQREVIARPAGEHRAGPGVHHVHPRGVRIDEQVAPRPVERHDRRLGVDEGGGEADLAHRRPAGGVERGQGRGGAGGRAIGGGLDGEKVAGALVDRQVERGGRERDGAAQGSARDVQDRDRPRLGHVQGAGGPERRRMHLRAPRGRQGGAAEQRAGAPVEHQQLGIGDAQHPIAPRIGQQRGDPRGGGDGGEPGAGRAGEGDDRGVSRREDQVRPAIDGDGPGRCAGERRVSQAGAAGGVERQQRGGGVDVDPPRRLVQRHRGGVLPRRAGRHQPRPFRRDQRVGQRGAGGESLRPLCPAQRRNIEHQHRARTQRGVVRERPQGGHEEAAGGLVHHQAAGREADEGQLAARPCGGVDGGQAPLRLPRAAAAPGAEVGHEDLPGAPGHRPQLRERIGRRAGEHRAGPGVHHVHHRDVGGDEQVAPRPVDRHDRRVGVLPGGGESYLAQRRPAGGVERRQQRVAAGRRVARGHRGDEEVPGARIGREADRGGRDRDRAAHGTARGVQHHDPLPLGHVERPQVPERHRMHLPVDRARERGAAQQRAGAPVEHQQLGIGDAQHPVSRRIGQQRRDPRGGGDGGEPGSGRAREGDDRGIARREDQVRLAVDCDGAGECAGERRVSQADAAGGVEHQQRGGDVDVDPPRRLIERYRAGCRPGRARRQRLRPFRRDQRVWQRGAGGEGLRPVRPGAWSCDQRREQRQRGYYSAGQESSLRHALPFSTAVPQTTPIRGTAAWLRCVSSREYCSAGSHPARHSTGPGNYGAISGIRTPVGVALRFGIGGLRACLTARHRRSPR